MKRPIGVTLSSIVLGLMAALQLTTALIMALSVFAARYAFPVPAQDASVPAVSPGLLLGIFLVIAVILVALAGWAIATLIGLFRLRNWARYSILVIGGCLVALSLFSLFGVVISAAVMPVTPAMRNLPGSTMHVLLVTEALYWILIAALGAWWLVYFNLRSTRSYFLPGYAVSAAYLEAGTALQADTAAPPPPGRFSRVPTPIIVLAALSLVSAVLCLPSLFLPFPMFFFGFLIDRPASTCIFGLLILLFTLVGLGLLRLDNRARIAIYVVTGLNLANSAVFLTPWCRARFNLYMQQTFEKWQVPGTPPIDSFFSGPALLFSAFFGLAIYAFVVWILHRYRRAFLSTTSETS